MKPELNLTAHTYRDEQRNEFTQVTAQCECGRGGWIRLPKHIEEMPGGRMVGKTWKAFTKCLQWAQQGKTFIYVHPRFVAIDTQTWLKLNKDNIGHKIVYFEEYQPWSKEMQAELEKIKSSHAVDSHQFRQEYLGDWKGVESESQDTSTR